MYKNEKGQALYLAMVSSFLIFMVLAHVLAVYVQQVRMVQLKEMDVRSTTMVQSAVTLWITNIEEEQVLSSVSLEDGIVSIDILDEDDKVWHLSMIAHVQHSEVTHRVDLAINKSTGKVVSWEDM